MADSKASDPSAEFSGHLDSPVSGESVYDQAIYLSGWVHAADRDPACCRVRAFLDGTLVAETSLLFCRPDVCRHLKLSPCPPTGFRMLGRLSPPAKEASDAILRILASWNDGETYTLAERQLRLVPALLHQRPHGEVVHPENETLLHRDDIYGSGPPLEEPSAEAAALIAAYLPQPTSVVDVGCGAGAYGPGLIRAGHDWLGLEASPHCCDLLQHRQLPFRRVDRETQRLPGSDEEWDCAICLEVLEHTEEPEAFVREIARVTRTRVLFSVPNMEVLPYLYGWAVVPWHLLEADHKNFFTRASLRRVLETSFRRVEVIAFGQHPLATRDGIAVYTHLFAVADK